MTARDASEPGRPRVLVLAYSCNPYRGSEPGAGWIMVRAIAEVADVVVLVGPHHQDDIQRWQQEHPDARMTFVTVPFAAQRSTLLSKWTQFDRRASFIKYILWLRNAKRTALALEAQQPFDASVHATYGSYWLPSPLRFLKAPMVWGPVGGGTRTPLRLWKYLGWRGALGELQKVIALRIACLVPATRDTWRKAAIRLFETDNSIQALPAKWRGRSRIINRATMALVPPDAVSRPRQPYLIFPSLMEPRKGARLAIHALALAAPHVKLRFLSGGLEEEAVKRLAKRLNVADRVEFFGRIPRDEMFEMMAECAGVLFTGLREEGGMALAESMMMGAPVIVLGIGGALHIASRHTDPSRIRIIEPGSAKATAQQFADAMMQFCAEPSQGRGGYLDQLRTQQDLQQAVLDAVVGGRTATSPVNRAAA